jgi:uncharacterized membrane protein YfcA
MLPPVPWDLALGCLAAGLVIAALTTPVGVSGAVVLLPVQVSLLGVPSPAAGGGRPQAVLRTVEEVVTT